ncbi:hypothetical protein CK203_064972 [Vitis vinifera]|uniref:Endonuclease/exonuclease/phosphatase domain-containing protein n=1 Tax=Vitis vinifera TaxID=29760 RepID=A0A438G2V1_VITVI|nr:hypothetical protein CK203_064972 [Vitis vinifera]
MVKDQEEVVLFLMGDGHESWCCERNDDSVKWVEVGRAVARSLGKKGVVTIVPISAVDLSKARVRIAMKDKSVLPALLEVTNEDWVFTVSVVVVQDEDGRRGSVKGELTQEAFASHSRTVEEGEGRVRSTAGGRCCVGEDSRMRKGEKGGLVGTEEAEEIGVGGDEASAVVGCRAYERKAQSLSKIGPKYAKEEDPSVAGKGKTTFILLKVQSSSFAKKKVMFSSKKLWSTFFPPSSGPDRDFSVAASLYCMGRTGKQRRDPKKRLPGADFQAKRGSSASSLFSCRFLRFRKKSLGEGASSSRNEVALNNFSSDEDSKGFFGPSGVRSSWLNNHGFALYARKQSPSVPNLPGSAFQSQFPMENQEEEQMLHRGLGSRKKRRVVKDFLRSEKPDVVMIQETKKAECDRRFMGSVWTIRNKEWTALPTCGASGRILIIWDSKKLHSEEVVLGSFSVSVKFALDGCESLWLSTVYGPNNSVLRKDFWVELSDIFGLSSPRWCVGGDFNVIRRSSEKLGGSSLTPSMKDFDDFIRDCELIDSPLRRAPFNWSNMQEYPSWKPIRSSGPNTVQVGEYVVCNILVLRRALEVGGESFKEWVEGHKFMRKLQFVKAKLKEWNKASFGALNERKKSILSDLANFDTLEQEGVANGKRNRKFIKVLENERGLVMNNSESIKEEILRYFEKLYVSPSGESWRVEGLNWSPISGESASRLESPFTEEEISKAIFQLDRDKARGLMTLPLQCFKIVGM